MKRILFLLTTLLILLTLPVWAGAADYYVTQGGAGDESGQPNVANAMPVEDFNALTGAGYAGDTFYFSGTITTRVTIDIEGTAGNILTLDGYEAGDCDAIDNDSANGALLSDGMELGDDVAELDYVTIQDFRMTKSSGAIVPCFRMWDSGSARFEHIIFQRNYIYETYPTMAYFGKGDYITVDANKLTHFGQGNDATQGVNFNIVTNLIVTNNEFGHDEDAYPSDCTSANTVEVHNTQNALFEYNEIYGAPNSSGLVIKEGGNCTNIIVRFNHIYDNGEVGTGKGIYVVNSGSGELASYIYIYGNYSHGNSVAQVMSRGNVDYLYIFSNILSDGGRNGITFSVNGGASPDYAYIYNNTIAGNNTEGDTDYSRGGITITSGSHIYINNNIFMDNRPAGAGSKYNQIYSSITLSSLEHNDYFHSLSTPTWYYDGAIRSLATMQGTYGFENDAPAGFIGDPGLTNPANSNFTIAASNSAVVDAGTDLSGSVNITIQGTVYNVDFSTRLHPSTDWNTTPPTVIGVSDASYGSWNIGAYEWTATGNQAPNGTITSPIPNSPTIDKTETLLFSGSYTDPESDTCTYAWTWEADSMAIWADATGYDAEPTTTAEVSLVLHGGVYYKCIQDHTSETGVIEPPNVTYWTANANTLTSPGRAIFNTEVGSPFAYSLTVTDDAPLADPTPASGSITVNDPEGGSPPTTKVWSKNSGSNYDIGGATIIAGSHQPTNYGTDIEVSAYYKSYSADYNIKGFLIFDLSDIIGETVTDAILSLYLGMNPGSLDTDIQIWSVTSSAIVEAEASWDVYSTGNAWASEHQLTGHGKTTLLASTHFTTTSTEGQYYDFTGEALTSYLATTAAAGGTAYLMIFEEVHNAGVVKFVSDDGDDAKRPSLSINYGASDPGSVPEIVNITTNTADGSYIDGDSVGPFLVTLSEPVDVTGTPQLTLELGATDAVVNYISGTGTATLTFAAFTVASVSSHTSADLDGTQLALNGGTILSTDDATSAANNGTIYDVFPTGATIGSLAYNKDIAIDTTAPAVTAVNNTDPDATGDSTISAVDTLVVFAIDVNSPCIVYAAPGFPRIEMTVNLTETVYANYVGQGDDTDILLMGFYTTAGMRSLDLNFTGDIDLGPGGKITDLAGNDIDISMGALSLAAVAEIVIAVPYPSTAPKEFTDAADYTAWLAGVGYTLPTDHYIWTEAADTDGFDASGEHGTAGNEINYNAQGYPILGSQIFGNYSIIQRFIHGSTVELGLGNTHKYDLIPVGDILKVPEGATGCTIHDDSIRGTLDLDEQVGADTPGVEVITDATNRDFSGAGDWTGIASAATVTVNYDSLDVGHASTMRVEAGDADYEYSNIPAAVGYTVTSGTLYELVFDYKDIESTNVIEETRTRVIVGSYDGKFALAVSAVWDTKTIYFIPTDSGDFRLILYVNYSVGHADNETLFDSVTMKPVTSDTGIFNTWITDIDVDGLAVDEPIWFANCAFEDSKATIEAKNANDVLYFDDECQFSITTADCFRDYAGADFHLTAGSPLKDAGEDTGADVDLEGRITPIGAAHDIGAYELRVTGRSMGMGMGLRGYSPYRPDN